MVGPPPLDNLPTGPPVIVMRGSVAGERFTVTVRDDPSGMCHEMSYGGLTMAGEVCGGTLPGEGAHAEHFGWLAGGGSPVMPGAVEVSGVVAPEVEAVVIQTRSGGTARASLVSLDPAGIDAIFFVAYLREGDEARAAIALDSEGSVLERFEFLPLAPPPEHGVPTPAPEPS